MSEPRDEIVVRLIARDEMRKETAGYMEAFRKMAKDAAEEASISKDKVREIVREELRLDRETPAQACRVEPKPKSDLERAAAKLKELAQTAELQMKDCTSGSSQWFHASGYFQAMYDAEAYVQAMVPASTDWRKIAEGLADSLRGVCKFADPYDGWAEPLKSYDAAVKEADK